MAQKCFGPDSSKDTFYTFSPLNRILRFFVLTNVKKIKNNLVPSWSILENVAVFSVITIINALFMVFKIQTFSAYSLSGSIRFIDSIQLLFIVGYIQYINDLIFLNRTRSKTLKYLLFYKNVDSLLGYPNFIAMRSTVSKMVLFSILISTLTTGFDYYAWTSVYGWWLPSLYALGYFYFFLNLLTILDVSSQLIQIEHRLKIMVKYIEDYYTSNWGSIVQSKYNEIGKPSRVECLRTVSSRHFAILLLNKSYLLLLEQVYFINEAYGMRLLVYFMNILISLIFMTNLVLRIPQWSSEVGNKNILPLFTSIVRIINYIAVVLILIYRCEKTYRQSSAIIRMIDLTLVNEKSPNDIQKSLVDLRSLIFSRPIVFHAANYFTCNYPLVVSVTSVIATYTIILYQSMK